METEVGTISNYYGGLSIKKEGRKHFWGIEDHDGETKFEEIPKKLYDALYSFEKNRKSKFKKKTKKK